MKAIFIMMLLFCAAQTKAQELYPSTEPASAMSAKSVGLRLETSLFPSFDSPNDIAIQNKTSYRLNPEFMWGINKKWMAHLNFYASNIHQNDFRFEGSNVYVKYRFFSSDEVQSHFRVAVYGKVSAINNAIQYHEINLAGDNSGIGAGIIATQLIHKVALSFTGGYLRSMNNLKDNLSPTQARNGFNYSFSTGYLFLPMNYTSYKQINLNLYVEFLGKSNPASKENYLDFAPALQLILNSIMRLDFIYQKQFLGNMLRINNTLFLFRFEYNLLNAYK